jgi:hypothetical protein
LVHTSITAVAIDAAAIRDSVISANWAAVDSVSAVWDRVIRIVRNTPVVITRVVEAIVVVIAWEEPRAKEVEPVAKMVKTVVAMNVTEAVRGGLGLARKAQCQDRCGQANT